MSRMGDLLGAMVESAKDGSFGYRMKSRLSPMPYLQNEFAKRVEARSRAYKTLYKKYHQVLDRELTLEESKKSNYVWICWFQGLKNAPPLVKACVQSVKENLKDKEIVILTNETIPEYVEFPDYIQKKWEKGMMGAAHYSDLLRVELL